MKTKENAWANAYADFVLRNRWVIIILLVAATIVAALQIHKLDIRNDPDTLLPPSNRYVATNLYAEHNFGMGNLMVFALKVKEGDIWQPWFINKVQEIHNKLEALPHSRPANFIDIAAQKIKYMGTDENGLVFKRLIPTEGISDDPQVAREQLAFLREGVKGNPVMAPMLVSMWDKDGNRCAYEDYDKDRRRRLGEEDMPLISSSYRFPDVARARRACFEEIARGGEFPLTDDPRRCRFCTYATLCERESVRRGLDDLDADEEDLLADLSLEQIAEVEPIDLDAWVEARNRLRPLRAGTLEVVLRLRRP